MKEKYQELIKKCQALLTHRSPSANEVRVTRHWLTLLGVATTILAVLSIYGWQVFRVNDTAQLDEHAAQAPQAVPLNTTELEAMLGHLNARNVEYERVRTEGVEVPDLGTKRAPVPESEPSEEDITEEATEEARQD